MQLTAEQLKAVEKGQPLRFSAPETNSEFVVLRADLFDRFKALFAEEEFDPRLGYAAFRRAAGDEWDDPSLDVYEQYRKKP
jgi:hypothetical protein